MIDVERSQAPPASLARERSWAEDDVIETLHRDFHRKCYLCEIQLLLRFLEVDHRHPRNEGGAPFDWNNLFPICGACNKRRPKHWPACGLLSPGDGVDTRLAHSLEPDESGTNSVARFDAVDPGDAAACATAAELAKIHDTESGTTGARSRARELLQTMSDWYFHEIRPVEQRVLVARRDGSSNHEAEQALLRLLGPAGQFAAMMRSCVDASLWPPSRVRI